jgi:outer membrane receptor protein involved in Fe transport
MEILMTGNGIVRLARTCVLAAGLVGILCGPVAAQLSGIDGVVRNQAGEPIAGATVTLVELNRSATSDIQGRFLISGVQNGRYTLLVRGMGFDVVRRSITVPAGEELTLELVPAALVLDDIVISGTREGALRSETAAAVGVVTGDALASDRPAHPSEAMNQVPGVYVNTTGGEGHMAAIRQPITTDPVYLYLEDGIPTRSTGFFNHNALYEINVPQASRIEVFKGPATALYGSDAIGGVINVTTRAPSARPEVRADIEGGEHTWGRILLSGSDTFSGNGVRVDLNLTRTDGWRAGTEYDRQSATARWDRDLRSAGSLQTVVAFSNINQQTAGTSAISRTDFETNPTVNYTPISFREVGALRVSTAWERSWGRTLLSVTPFFRRNTMDLLPNWSLTYDPTVYETANSSVGMLAKARFDFDQWRSRVIVGFDADMSPGDRTEWAIAPERDGAIFSDFVMGDALYDYDVRFQGFSPYIHTEFSPVDPLRITLGLRADFFGYDYDNQLSEVQTGSHRRPGDATLTFAHVSPKVGATVRITPELSVFTAYRHGFRAPSEGQLFRQGPAENTVGLEPVKVNSFEAGIRGSAAGRVTWDLSAYRMTKTDDILAFEEPDGTRLNVNAGETSHRGIEAGLGIEVVDGLTLQGSYSYAKHTYEEWQPQADVDLSGNEMESAPREIGNLRLQYRPAFRPDVMAGVEFARIGSYWEDAANASEYEGHILLNLRFEANLYRGLGIYGRLMNVTNERYAERASYNAFRGEELAPGLPRTVYLGVTYR